LDLEPASTSHAPEMVMAIERSVDHLLPWLVWVHGSTLEHTLEHLNDSEMAWQRGTAYGFAIRMDGGVVGSIEVRVGQANPAEGNIGYWVAAGVARQGVGTEAGGALVEFCFHTLGLKRLEIRAHVDNIASWRVAEKLGMRREGRARGGVRRLGGELGDAHLYGMLAGDPRRDARSGEDGRPEGAPVVKQPDFSRGLVTAVIQDELDGAVLMVAHMNQEAYRKTLSSGRAWFWSRSRERLWEKGESSGNHLEVRSVALDCDGDAVLLRVVPGGPACHTGARTCFHNPV
jgi:phosphoribosyl-AMP cyclohydrolase/RimJ/RimL family protein N-acetyltransferase